MVDKSNINNYSGGRRKDPLLKSTPGIAYQITTIFNPSTPTGIQQDIKDKIKDLKKKGIFINLSDELRKKHLQLINKDLSQVSAETREKIHLKFLFENAKKENLISKSKKYHQSWYSELATLWLDEISEELEKLLEKKK